MKTAVIVTILVLALVAVFIYIGMKIKSKQTPIPIPMMNINQPKTPEEEDEKLGEDLKAKNVKFIKPADFEVGLMNKDEANPSCSICEHSQLHPLPVINVDYGSKSPSFENEDCQCLQFIKSP